MKFDQKTLVIIMPTTKGAGALPSIESVFAQEGFRDVFFIATGKSTQDPKFIEALEQFPKNKTRIALTEKKGIVLPGEARNNGLDLLFKEGLKTSYILFVDDDIVLPADYALELAKFLEVNRSAAVMGRVSSRPENFWTKVIDYSNFWWLQMDTDVKKRGFLGAGATIMRANDIKKIRFNNKAKINEDTLFFLKLSRLTKRPLSFCAKVTAEHYHGRKNFLDFFLYQFNNGRHGVRFRGSGFNIVWAARKAWRTFCHAYRGNKSYLRKNKKLAFGVLLSFAIFQMGIEVGSWEKAIKNLFKKKGSKK